MGWLSSLLSGKKQEPDYPAVHDFSGIATDIHSHLIPGIDDGAANMEESIALLQALQELGFTKVITTPHIMSDYFRNTPEIILTGLDALRKAASESGIKLQIDAAAEYYFDEQFVQMVKKKEKLLTIGNKYLLFEVSYINQPDNLLNVVFDISMNGYIPLLAHPERYPFWYGKHDMYQRLREAGVLFQINSNSLCGYYGEAARKTAEYFIDQNMVEFIGSDMHGQRHLEALRMVVNEKSFRKLNFLGVRNPTV